jgi:exonuclease III
MFHFKCLPVYQLEDLEYAQQINNLWTCPYCLKEIFPLAELDDDEITTFMKGTGHNSIEHLNELLFDPYELSEEGGVFEDIDPDDNYLNVLASQTIHKCRYYLPEVLKEEIEKRNVPANLSIIHMNIRSTKKNFKDLQMMLSNLEHTFTCVALTETWLKTYNAALFDIEGYTHEFITRETKLGGGISIYIRDDTNYKVRTDLNISTNDTEMLWIEIDNSHQINTKNLIMGAIYRRPGSDIEIFNKKLLDTLETITNEKKNTIYTGDFNIDIIKASTHKLTNQFMEINFSLSMTPLISRPTRITSTSATLIDNFFTDSVGCDPIIGVIPIEISDHYPICYITHEPTDIPKQDVSYKRNFSRSNMDNFKILIDEMDWDPIVRETDTQMAYNALHDKFDKAFKKSYKFLFNKYTMADTRFKNCH